MIVEAWREILDVLTQHKLRTLLTSASVAWGVFLLVILLAAGQGLHNGVRYDFRDDAINSIWIEPSKTSLPFAGHGAGRFVALANDDVRAVQDHVEGVEHLSARFYLPGSLTASRGGRISVPVFRGVHPDHLFIERTIVTRGRFVNERDIEQRRHVAVIGTSVRHDLFDSWEDPIGRVIDVRGAAYTVVGTFEDQGSPEERRTIYVPISTAQLAYKGKDLVHHIIYTTRDSTLAQTEAMADATRRLLARRHHFDPADRRALRITNGVARYDQAMDLLNRLRYFVWIVGLGTLLSGVVSVSNIMLVAVQERTTEIGVRRALGATPTGVVAQIVAEALCLTSVAGYLGLVTGVGVVAAIRDHLPENDFLREPSVDLRVGLVALVVLTFSGVGAGLLPALRAARIRPVEAMRRS